VAGIILAGLVWLGIAGAGRLPPLGPLLDPARGTWATLRAAELPADASARIPGLQAPVEVAYDVRGVPHIYAANSRDLYRALGFVVARDRLLQLDLQTLAGSGRLTEVAGVRALRADRQTRQLGLPVGAERRWAALAPTSESRLALEAYSAGVNAWIDQLTPTTLPLEYRLLHRAPPRWQPINTLYLQARMSWTLAYSDAEFVRARTAALVGDSAAQALFPVHSSIAEPIIPAARRYGPLPLARVPDPGAPDAGAAQAAERLTELAGALGIAPARETAGGALGSNNWAVSPSRSATGHALLAGDPHLDLTLPSIWYEVHLVVRDSIDVYGVTIPGTPGVVIGFTRDAAWTFTNTGADVLDVYAEQADDATRPTRTRLDKGWRPVSDHVEEYRDPSGALLHVDTIPWIRRGPMVRDNGGWVSLRWTANEGGDEVGAFLRAAHAHSTADVFRAFEQYRAPVQNLLAADRTGVIAIRSIGRIPRRPKSARGDVIQDGSSTASDWVGDIAIDSLPTAVSPAQGFLASANQEPFDPREHPEYLGTNWEAPWRAERINTLLRNDPSVTTEDMRRFQTDPGSAHADRFVPYLLAAVRNEAALKRASSEAIEAARLLGQWDRQYTRDDHRAVLFTTTMERLGPMLWDELALHTDQAGGLVTGWPYRLPSSTILAQLLEQPTSPWWDDRSTPTPEHRDEILARAMASAYTALLASRGSPERAGWAWGNVRQATINHLLRLPALGRSGVSVAGGIATISPSTGDGTHGASWRMVVDLGTPLRAWATYPGGQSGNPISRHYADRVRQWQFGELDALVVPASLEAAPRRWVTRLHMTGTR
jgi:penicillin amidase